MSIEKWKVLKIDEYNNLVYLLPSTSYRAKLKLQGAQGYNNAVNLLDEACSSLYGNEEKGIKAESIDMELIESLMEEGEANDSAKTWKQAKENANYLKTRGKVGTSYNNYPIIYAQESLSVIGNKEIDANSGLGMSDKPMSKIERNTGTLKIGAIDGTNSALIKPYKTYYSMTKEEFPKALGKYSNVILPNGINTSYWVASRCIHVDGSLGKYFGVRGVSSGSLWACFNMFAAGNGNDTNGYSLTLFPVLAVPSNLITQNNKNEFEIN